MCPVSYSAKLLLLGLFLGSRPHDGCTGPFESLDTAHSCQSGLGCLIDPLSQLSWLICKHRSTGKHLPAAGVVPVAMGSGSTNPALKEMFRFCCIYFRIYPWCILKCFSALWASQPLSSFPHWVLGSCPSAWCPTPGWNAKLVPPPLSSLPHLDTEQPSHHSFFIGHKQSC